MRVRSVFSNILLFAFLAVVTTVAQAFVVTSPAAFAGIQYDSPILDCLKEQYTVEGPAIHLDLLPDEIRRNQSIRFDGYTVFVPPKYVKVIFESDGDWELYRWKRRGAAAVLVIGNGPGSDGGAFSLNLPSDAPCTELLPMMAFGVSWEGAERMKDLLRQQPNITIRASPGDPSEWLEYNRKFSVPFRLIFTSVSGMTAAIALGKLIGFIRSFGPQFSVVQVCLSTTFLITVFRTIYHALDPIYLGRLFNGSVSLALMSITFPFDLLGMLLVGLYWSELMDTSHVGGTRFLTKFRWPFLAVVLVIIVLELISSILRATVAVLSIAAMIIGIGYITATLTLTSVFFYNGIKVMQFASNSRVALSRSYKAFEAAQSLRRTTHFLLASAFCNLIWLAGLFMAAITHFSNSGLGFHVSMTTMWVGITGAALTQVLGMKMPEGHYEATVNNTTTTDLTDTPVTADADDEQLQALSENSENSENM